MKIYAISDLHLSLDGSKPMDVFGDKWEGYLDKIEYNWNNLVTDDDYVLISGDISWAMKLVDAPKDLIYLNRLKGHKVLIKGNHEYWWNGITKVRNILPNDTIALQNDSIKIGNYVICGSRGWAVPGSPDFEEKDEKIFLREVERFKLSLKSAKSLQEDGDKLIVMIHYPPFNVRFEKSKFMELFEEFNVDKVVYGHLHGKDVRVSKKVNINGIEYLLTSCDLVNCELVEVY